MRITHYVLFRVIPLLAGTALKLNCVADSLAVTVFSFELNCISWFPHPPPTPVPSTGIRRVERALGREAEEGRLVGLEGIVWVSR